MQKDIFEFVKACPICYKKRQLYGRGYLTPIPPLSTVWSRLHFDIKLDIGRHHSHPFQHFICLTDAFSKYVYAEPLISNTSNYIFNFLQRVFCTFGPPHSLISDNAPEFNTPILLHLYQQFNVNFQPVAPYSPQANGQAEAVVKILKNLLTKQMLHVQHHYNLDDTKTKDHFNGNWPSFLNYAIHIHNTTPTIATKNIPNHLMFNRRIRDPYNTIDPTQQPTTTTTMNREARQHLRQRMKQMIKLTTKNMLIFIFKLDNK